YDNFQNFLEGRGLGNKNLLDTAAQVGLPETFEIGDSFGLSETRIIACIRNFQFNSTELYSQRILRMSYGFGTIEESMRDFTRRLLTDLLERSSPEWKDQNSKTKDQNLVQR